MHPNIFFFLVIKADFPLNSRKLFLEKKALQNCVVTSNLKSKSALKKNKLNLFLLLNSVLSNISYHCLVTGNKGLPKRPQQKRTAHGRRNITFPEYLGVYLFIFQKKKKNLTKRNNLNVKNKFQYLKIEQIINRSRYTA